MGKKKHDEVETTEDVKEDDVPQAKVAKLFSGKEFRQKLQTSGSTAALENFIALCSNKENAHKYIFDYIHHGGTCLELFQLLDEGKNVPQIIVFEAVNLVLLQIMAKHSKEQSNAYEACRYFLNTHIMMINKMLGLASTSKERIAVLKVLTAIVLFSDGLAKEVLVNVNFHSANLEVLTKHADKPAEETVRSVFIKFILAFVVNGNYPLISLLLTKKGLLTSIVYDLRFDSAETVTMVIATLQENVLKNPSVTKTVKMKTFSTPVVKNIVNLYNWKGPAGANKKTPKDLVEVDEVDKSAVSDAVHTFLLILCTSHKHGVIFRDSNLSAGKKHQNALMYTVLESLERPWEHSYACVLVTKICAACPDLVKTMWANVKTFLEPRSTVQWLKAVDFTKVLLGELQPSCIEYCVKDLSAQQYVQTVQLLVAPTLILKTVYPAATKLDLNIKSEIVTVINAILVATKSYLKFALCVYPQELHKTLKAMIGDHLTRNCPSPQDLLSDWNVDAGETPQNFPVFSPLTHLENIITTLEYYADLCPSRLDGLFTENLFTELLDRVSAVTDENNKRIVDMLIKIVRVFIRFEPNLFMPNTKMFSIALPLLLDHYSLDKSVECAESLKLMLRNSGVFDSSDSEIDIWVNGIFNVKSYDENIGLFLVESLKLASDNLSQYNAMINGLLSQFDESVLTSGDDLMEMLTHVGGESASTIKHVYFSPVLISGLESQANFSQKNVKQYINFVLLNIFHSQTNVKLFITFINNYGSLISKNLLNYFNSWTSTPEAMSKIKGNIDTLEIISDIIIQADLNFNIPTITALLTVYPTLKVDSLRLIVFYLTNLNEYLSEDMYKTCVKLSELALSNNYDVILTHPVMLQNFAPLHISKNDHKSFCTLFLTEIVQKYDKTNQNMLNPFRRKLYARVLKQIKKGKTKNIDKLLSVINIFGFNYTQCAELLSILAEVPSEQFLNENNEHSLIYTVTNYALCNLTSFCRNDASPIKQTDFIKLAQHLANSNQKNIDTSEFAKNIHDYLAKFPHELKTIPQQLFESILQKHDYCKENSMLAVQICKARSFVALIENNIESVVAKKGLFLPLLDIIMRSDVSPTLKQKMYKLFEPSVMKVLQKPQKAGQHFEKHHLGLCKLLKEQIPLSTCKPYLTKVQKFDTTEIFHAQLLSTIYHKYAKDETTINNAVSTLVHLLINQFKQKLKSNKEFPTLETSVIIKTFVKTLKPTVKIAQNESYKLFIKFLLKFGIGGETQLLELFTEFLRLVKYEETDMREIMEMVTSHSEFVDTVLNPDTGNKKTLLDLLFRVCEKYSYVMDKSHIPVLLGGYTATIGEADKITLQILKLYEALPAQTNFYDFKPLLWHSAAITHYSIRSDMQKSLWRQPKMRDVLDILQESWVLETIKQYPLHCGLDTPNESLKPATSPIYDIRFLLPLFSQILAPENSVQTFRFTQSGGLSLTLAALSSDVEDVRKAACHVLARFYFHLEARTGGKDNLVWLRFIEAVCRGTAVFEDFKLNNFAALFLSRMALILTKPHDVMYLPLSQYLSAKPTPNLTAIPELYTFLRSSDVNHKEHRVFILKVLKDGLRTSKDIDVFSYSMAHKLLLELYNSSVCDFQSRLLILDVLKNVVAIKPGCISFCKNYGLLSWLHEIVRRTNDQKILYRITLIIENVLTHQINLNLVELILTTILQCNKCLTYKENFINCILNLCRRRKEFLTESRLNEIIKLAGDSDCKYMIDYSYEVIEVGEEDVDKSVYYVKQLINMWLSNKK